MFATGIVTTKAAIGIMTIVIVTQNENVNRQWSMMELATLNVNLRQIVHMMVKIVGVHQDAIQFS